MCYIKQHLYRRSIVPPKARGRLSSGSNQSSLFSEIISNKCRNSFETLKILKALNRSHPTKPLHPIFPSYHSNDPWWRKIKIKCKFQAFTSFLLVIAHSFKFDRISSAIKSRSECAAGSWDKHIVFRTSAGCWASTWRSPLMLEDFARTLDSETIRQVLI